MRVVVVDVGGLLYFNLLSMPQVFEQSLFLFFLDGGKIVTVSFFSGKKKQKCERRTSPRFEPKSKKRENETRASPHGQFPKTRSQGSQRASYMKSESLSSEWEL